MKKTLAVIGGLALMGAAVQSFAALNATIYENNYDVNTSISLATGGGLGTDAWIEVLAGPAGGALSVVGGAFHPLEAGKFDNGVWSIPGVTAGANADFQVRAWVGDANSTYATATTSGITPKFTQATGSWDDAATPPAPATGPSLNVPNFTVGPAGTIPEPTTLALGALGAAALLALRRRQ